MSLKAKIWQNNGAEYAFPRLQLGYMLARKKVGLCVSGSGKMDVVLLHVLHAYRSVFLGCLILALMTTAGCSFQQPKTVIEVEAVPYAAHVAFAGGGWRAHTGHSAWTMSLLDNGEKTLDDVFVNVGTISSNSGGSWFNTMLAYSDSFVTAIEAQNAISTWANSGSQASGWLGQQQYLFDLELCDSLSGDAFLACVFLYYTERKVTYWEKVVEKIVFNNNKINEPLNGTRQPWAKDKALLFAATMLTTEAVLGEVALDKQQYYQACLSPSMPFLDGDKGASCSGSSGVPSDVTPVTFSTMPKQSNLTAPPFFSATGSDTSAAYFNLGYTENTTSPNMAYTTVANPLTSDTLSVITAAAASSAAGGFLASKAVSGTWPLSYATSAEALNFQLAGSLQYVDADGKNVSELATDKIVQIADGGAVDNSAVAQLISFLQQNNQADGFNIVAFDNVQEIYSPGRRAANVGSDIANLFGKALQNGNQICSGTYCVTVPDLKIFQVNALDNTASTWSAAASTNNPPNVINELIYTKYTVTTVDNSTFGIKAGTTGTLHAFTAAWSGSNTAPQNADGDFKAYGAMLNFINMGLKQTNAAGRTGQWYLEEAFGLAE